MLLWVVQGHCGLCKVVVIRDVLCVPEFVTNLLSVGKLNDQGMPVTFVRDMCYTYVCYWTL
jgi:hypothetical protein